MAYFSPPATQARGETPMSTCYNLAVTRANAKVHERISNAADTVAVGHNAASLTGYIEALREWGLISQTEFVELSQHIADAANLRLQQLRRAPAERTAVHA